MWTDNETTYDLLGFRVHADLIRAVITDPSMLPVTVGVFGDWGGGKTSVLKMLEQDLDPDRYNDGPTKERYKKVACLYINGWLFEGYDDAKAALLTSVLMALGEHKRFGPKVRQKAAGLIKSVNWMRVARFGIKEVAIPAVAAYVSGGATAIPAIASVLGRAGRAILPGQPMDVAAQSQGSEPATASSGTPPQSGPTQTVSDKLDWDELIRKDQQDAGPLDVRSFRERFAGMLSDSDIETLVVLIDDLDRCQPERIIDNLEAIKLFLNVPGTAFVIGADPRIVRHAIARRYSPQTAVEPIDQESDQRLVTDYLEKLIQIPYGLPRLSPAETETYMALLFASSSLEAGPFEKCRAAFEAQQTENRYSVFGYAAIKAALGGGELEPSLSASLLFSAQSAPLITEGLKGNPRQVKRFLNALMLRKRLATIAKLTHMKDAVLVKLMILEYAQPKLFQELYSWQAAQDGFPSEMRTMEDALRSKGNEAITDLPWSGDFARRWIKMDPTLAEIDLRDYFWVARDRLASTLSGVSLIPPAVRRVLDDLLSGSAGKVKAAAGLAATFETDQQAILFDALGTQLERQPESKIGYDAVRQLVESGLSDAITVLTDAASSIPPEKVPAAVAMDLQTLMNAHQSIKSRTQAVLSTWAQTDTKVGRALRPKPGRGR